MSNMHRNIRLLEIQEIMMRAIFIIPVLVLYFRDEIGLSFQEFLICQTVFSFTVVVLEIPSGWISDIWNRKHVLVMSNVLWIISFSLLMFADSLATVICVEIVMGVAMSLFSGTNSALLYDTLLTFGSVDGKEYTRLEGKRRALSLYSVAIASLAGGFLYEIDPNLPVLMTVGAMCIGLICAFFLIEPPRQKEKTDHHPIKDMLITMRYALHGHTAIGMIIMVSSALFCSTSLIMWIQQPYYIELNIPKYMFGVLMAVGYCFGGLASHISHLISKYLNNFKALFIAWGLAIIVCVGAAVSFNAFGIALLMFGGTFISGAFMPQVQNEINKRVGSERRATILSTASFLKQITYIPLALVVGWSIDGYGLTAGLYTITIWLLVTGVCLVVWSVKKQKPKLQSS